MARIGRLGCTITRKFVWGVEVTNISKTFRGTITTPKNNGLVVRIDGEEIRYSSTLKRALRRLRQAAHFIHDEEKRILKFSHDVAMLDDCIPSEEMKSVQGQVAINAQLRRTRTSRAIAYLNGQPWQS